MSVWGQRFKKFFLAWIVFQGFEKLIAKYLARDFAHSAGWVGLDKYWHRYNIFTIILHIKLMIFQKVFYLSQ